MGTSTFTNCKINSIKVRKNSPEEISLINSSVGNFLYEELKPTNGRNKLTLNGDFGTCSLKIQSPCNITFAIGFNCNEIDIKTTKANDHDTLDIGTYLVTGYLSEVFNGINIKSNAILKVSSDSVFPAKNITIGDLLSNSLITVILQGDFYSPGNIINKTKLILENCTLSDLSIPNDESLPVTLELFPKYSDVPLITNKIDLGKNVTLSGSNSQIKSCINSNSEYIFDGYIEDIEISQDGSGFQSIPFPSEIGEYTMTAYLIENSTTKNQIGDPEPFTR